MSLKRSGFTRRLYVPPPVAPLTPPQSWNRARTDSLVAVPKMQLLRSESYRRWVSILPCCACGIEGWTQVAHGNQAKYGHGRSIKSGDQFVFPMCGPRPGHMGCHAMHDLRMDGLSKAERDALEDEYIERTLRLAREVGRPEIVELEEA